MPFEALGEAARFGGRKGLVERRRLVGVEIVLDEDDLLGIGEVDVGDLLQDMGVVDGGAPLADLDPPPAFERGEDHEQGASTRRLRARETLLRLVSSASTICRSVHAGPSLDSSAFKRILARVATSTIGRPLCRNSSSRVRSSALSRTTYFFPPPRFLPATNHLHRQIFAMEVIHETDSDATTRSTTRMGGLQCSSKARRWNSGCSTRSARCNRATLSRTSGCRRCWSR